jgi:hypothetical protein
MSYYNGRITLTDGQHVQAHLIEECAPLGACLCGFCKGDGQCEYGDCRNPLPVMGSVGTLCLSCSAEPRRAALPGHRASAA